VPENINEITMHIKEEMTINLVPTRNNGISITTRVIQKKNSTLIDTNLTVSINTDMSYVCLYLSFKLGIY
jgi:hypothetical protein